MHDIIDNRNEKLLDHIQVMLDSSERVRFAVGYLFLSGLAPIAEKLEKLNEIKLLVGNTLDTKLVETLVQDLKDLDEVRKKLDEQRFRRRVDSEHRVVETRNEIREHLSLMDQSDLNERLIRILLKLLKENRLHIRLYTKGRLHAKAYIFDYGTVYGPDGKPLERPEKGIAIIGSSNLTLSGLTHNTELNVIVHGNANHAALVEWFENLWKESLPFEEAIATELRRSWAVGMVESPDGTEFHVRPYDIYMKTLFELVRDRFEEEPERYEFLFDDRITRELADFQKIAVKQAVKIIKDYGGVFISDVVGLGKSYIGAAILKHFYRTEGLYPLIICPAGLVDMWKRFNTVYKLGAEVISIGELQEAHPTGQTLLDPNGIYHDRKIVLVDESHNFRNPDTQRYQILQAFMQGGRKAVLLTATPRNRTVWDIYWQLKLFHHDDRTMIPIEPNNLREFVKLAEKGERKIQDLLVHILIRRTRNHVLKWYGYDAQTNERVKPSEFDEYRSGKRKAYIYVGGQHRFFPRRNLETVTYSIEATYRGIYDKIRRYIGKPLDDPLNPPPNVLTYARYGLWNYVKPEKRGSYTDLKKVGANLCGLMRVLLFKRFESSVEAFRKTLKNLVKVHQTFRDALGSGVILAGHEINEVLDDIEDIQGERLAEELAKVSKKYKIDDFEVECLRKNIDQDIEVLKKMLELVEPITPKDDAKLQKLIEILQKPPLNRGKRLIFTQYADTAKYLYDNLVEDERLSFINRENTAVIYGNDRGRERIVGRFAPNANPWFNFSRGETELHTLIATDVLSEGLNLQDCDKIINYDLHWNPVRLIQRLGRIDRIGSEYDEIYAFNFLPERDLERHLGLHERLRRRIREIHETIGEDAAILDPAEVLNENAMYAIYTGNQAKLAEFEEESDIPLELNEIEEMMRALSEENPAEFERLKDMRYGLRTGKLSTVKGIFVFLKAGKLQKLGVYDKNGNPLTENLQETLGIIRCDEAEPSRPLPSDYNQLVMKIKSDFEAEVKRRKGLFDIRQRLPRSQKYVLRELKAIYEVEKSLDARNELAKLEEIFSKSLPQSVIKELNRLRRNGVTGKQLISALKEIVFNYSLLHYKEPVFTRQVEPVRIICSEALKI